MQGSWPVPVVVRPLFQIDCDAGVQNQRDWFRTRTKGNTKKKAHIGL